MLNNNKLNIALSIWIAFVFLQSIPFKFSGSEVTDGIFSGVGSFISSLGLNGIGSLFSQYGAYLVGALEIIASIMLLMAISAKYRYMRCEGALLAFVLMLGAIFFHLFAIGINVDGSPTLFIMAVTVLISSVILMKNSYKS